MSNEEDLVALALATPPLRRGSGFPYSLEHTAEVVRRLIDFSGTKAQQVIQPRNDPPARKIYEVWSPVLVHLNKFDSLAESRERICWACGMQPKYSLERAHILARVDGGSSLPVNYHMLCSECHLTSEFLFGRSYWEWFMRPTLHPAYWEHLLEKVRWVEVHGIEVEIPGDWSMSDVHQSLSESRTRAQRHLTHRLQSPYTYDDTSLNEILGVL